MPQAVEDRVVLSTFRDARDALRHRDLRQALYDEGRALMTGVIVNLHGDPHRDRRRLENRLFRRDTFLVYEHEVIPRIVDDVLAPARTDGLGDLLPLARRAMMTLSSVIAGVDRPQGTVEEFDDLYALMVRLSRASTVVHAVGDKPAIIDDGNEALAQFDDRFFAPSVERRRALLDAGASGDVAESELPRDVLTTLLRNQDDLHLPAEVVLREVAYFPWVGSHSTSNALVHAADHIFDWCAARPDDLARVTSDPFLRQLFVHESLRLHPASPEATRRALAPIELPSGTPIPQGATVVADLVTANRDPSVFGAAPDEFDPFRTITPGVAPWGLTFGSGFHACLGEELAGGLEPGPDTDAEHHLFGAITIMLGVLLANGARPDPDRPPEEDRSSRRPHFAAYPILLGDSA